MGEGNKWIFTLGIYVSLSIPGIFPNLNVECVGITHDIRRQGIVRGIDEELAVVRVNHHIPSPIHCLYKELSGDIQGLIS